MRTLCYDISLSTCSIAIFDGSECRAHTTFTPKTRHSAEFLPALTGLLDSCHLEIRDIGEIGYTNGPGSFTGLKVSASIAKGLGYALGIPVYPVSTIAALVRNVADVSVPVIPLIHAKIGELFAAVYVVRDGTLKLVRPEAAFTLDDALALVNAYPGATLIGSGIPKIAGYLNAEYRLAPESEWSIDARNILPLIGVLRGTGIASLLAIPPSYLRRSHAEEPTIAGH